MKKLLNVGLLIIAFLSCIPNVYSQSFDQPEFADSREKFMKEIFESDSCGIGVGSSLDRNFGIETLTNYLSFHWHLDAESDPKDEELFKNKFNKLMDTAPIRINNIGNYNVLQLFVYKDDIQVYKVEQKLE